MPDRRTLRRRIAWLTFAVGLVIVGVTAVACWALPLYAFRIVFVFACAEGYVLNKLWVLLERLATDA